MDTKDSLLNNEPGHRNPVQVLARQKKTYDYSHIDLTKSQFVASFLDIVTNEGTRTAFKERLTKFYAFVLEKYQMELDQLISLVRDNTQNGRAIDPAYDQYSLLSGFVAWLIRRGYSARYIRNVINNTKQFLEFKDIEFASGKLKAKVKLPRIEEVERTPLSIELIREILLQAEFLKFRTFLCFLGSIGCRPIEACAVRFCDLNLDSETPTVYLQAKYTKMKKARTVRINQWLAGQLRTWIAFRNRTRRTLVRDPVTGKLRVEWFTPKIDPQERIFAIHHRGKVDVIPDSIYENMHDDWTDLRRRLGIDQLDDTGHRMQITFYSFRRFVKTTISNMGYSDFSEFFIGHKGSTYWNAPDKQKEEVFSKIEGNFAFLDFNAVDKRAEAAERRAANVDQVAAENLSLKQQIENLYKILYAQGIIKKDV